MVYTVPPRYVNRFWLKSLALAFKRSPVRRNMFCVPARILNFYCALDSHDVDVEKLDDVHRRVKSIVQLVSHVVPASAEKACSQRQPLR